MLLSQTRPPCRSTSPVPTDTRIEPAITPIATDATVSLDRVPGGIQREVRTSNSPLVSVITPCLNPGPRLERCIQSIMAQTYRPIEHVVVDGGSTDGSQQLLRRHDHITWVSEPDRGQSDAINKGISLSSGHLLTWLNADDQLTPAATEQAVSAIGDVTVPDWAYGLCEVIGRQERYLLGPSRPLGFRSLELGNRIAQPGTFFTRAAIDLVGPLDEDMHLAMDLDLWIRFVSHGLLGRHIPELLAIFELHGDSKTVQVEPHLFYLEEVHAYLKADWIAAAELALGRAAAHAAISGMIVESHALEAAVSTLATPFLQQNESLRLRRIQRAARAEAVFTEHQAGRTWARSLHHVIALDPWRSRLPRRRARHALLRALASKTRLGRSPALPDALL